MAFGQLEPEDSASEYNKHRFLIKQLLGRVRTVTLVQVLACSNSGGVTAVGTVDVLPLVNMTDGVGIPTPHGPLFSLPYFRLQGGNNAIIIDPQVGDIGIALFADRDISAVKSSKQQSNPGSRRRFDMADGLYIGGVLNGIPVQYLEFSSNGITLSDLNGNQVIMEPGRIVLKSPIVEFTGALQVDNQNNVSQPCQIAGSINATGNVIAGSGTGDQVGLQSHTHPDPQGGNVGSPNAGT